MPLYQRVYIPHDVLLQPQPSYVKTVHLYGFVKLNSPGELADTFVWCSPQPVLAHVFQVGWTADFAEEATEQQMEEWNNNNCEVDDTSSDYDVNAILPHLTGDPFDADDDDDAREEAQSNW